ncbi:MAG: hypothetical protein IEMM0002_0276 [bacterium]|nr:MAG: hypothetical protein IEMM0002_0276 [bacterium]
MTIIEEALKRLHEKGAKLEIEDKPVEDEPEKLSPPPGRSYERASDVHRVVSRARRFRRRKRAYPVMGALVIVVALAWFVWDQNVFDIKRWYKTSGGRGKISAAKQASIVAERKPAGLVKTAVGGKKKMSASFGSLSSKKQKIARKKRKKMVKAVSRPAKRPKTVLDKPLSTVKNVKKSDTSQQKIMAAVSPSVKQPVEAVGKKRVDLKKAGEVRKKDYLSSGERLDFARELINDSLYSDALDNLKPIFDAPPGNWEPYLLMGTAYLGLGRLDKADDFFRQGIKIDDARPRLWLQRAIVAQQKDDHQSALKILREVEKIAPSMPEIKLNIGYSNDVLGNKAEAAKSYQIFLAYTEGREDYFLMRRQVFQRLLKLGYQPSG